METSLPEERSLFAHPMAKWSLFVIMLFVIWFAGWFAFAHWADGKLETALGNLSKRGITIECGDRNIIGFPFRGGVECSQVSVDDTLHSYQLKTGSVRTAAQLYEPRKNIIEIDGPFNLQTNTTDILASWQLMRIFADIEGRGFRLISANYENLTAEINARTIQSAIGTLHLRPTPGNEDDADMAANFQSLTFDGIQVPPVDLSLDATLSDGYADLVTSRRTPKAWLRDGPTANIRTLSLSLPQGGAIAMSGPLKVEADGHLTGTVNVGADELDKFAEWAAEANPELGPLINGLGQALAIVGQTTSFNGRRMQAIEVEIERGLASVAFITLGRIPALNLQ